MLEEFLHRILGVRVLSRRLERLKRSEVPVAGSGEVRNRELRKLILVGKGDAPFRCLLVWRHIRNPNLRRARVK